MYSWAILSSETEIRFLQKSSLYLHWHLMRYILYINVKHWLVSISLTLFLIFFLGMVGEVKVALFDLIFLIVTNSSALLTFTAALFAALQDLSSEHFCVLLHLFLFWLSLLLLVLFLALLCTILHSKLIKSFTWWCATDSKRWWWTSKI